jgi:adenylate cyclase
MSPSRINHLKSQLENIVWITFFWTVISIFQFLSAYSTVIQLNCSLGGFKPIHFFYGSLITGAVAGLIGGSIMVFFWHPWLRAKSYKWSLLNIFWSYTLVYIIVSAISSINFKIQNASQSLFDLDVNKRGWIEHFSFTELQSYLFWLMVVILTLITLLVNDKYGPGIFKSFLLGRYFQPKREERIFMFLDLKGSTSIAEKLGEVQYFNFLKDLFSDATPGILNSKGEIYQYVGDEIVVSWKREAGTKDANCLNCFFDIQQAILDKSAYYQDAYGTIPQFKAGLHYGFVMVGEIGVVKRDIAYSGDVLNTAARIQSKCNEFGVKILVSANLIESLGSLPDSFKSTAIGKIDLRGKQEAMLLYTL